MQPEFVRFAVTFAENVPVAILGFVTKGSSPTLPSGAQWLSPGVWTREPSSDNLRTELAKAFPPGQPQPVSWRRIELDEIPADPSFRNAWVDSGTAITHDMVKARTMHLDRLRDARALEFARLDAEWMRAAGQKDQTDADLIEAERQVLRDMPVTVQPALAAAQTIEDLKRITLAG